MRAMIPVEGRRLPATMEHFGLNLVESTKRERTTGRINSAYCSCRRSVSVEEVCPPSSRIMDHRSRQIEMRRIDHSIKIQSKV